MRPGMKFPIVTSDNKQCAAFAQQVARSAIEEVARMRWIRADTDDEVAVGLECTFYLAKPKAVKRRLFPMKKPDFDKLTRAVADALTGIVYDDDGQICESVIHKRYGAPERTEIRVWILAPAEVPEVEPCARQLVMQQQSLY